MEELNQLEIIRDRAAKANLEMISKALNKTGPVAERAIRDCINIYSQSIEDMRPFLNERFFGDKAEKYSLTLEAEKQAFKQSLTEVH